MLSNSSSIAKYMGCCSCFGFARKRNPLARPTSGFNNCLSQELLLEREVEDDDEDCSYIDGVNSTGGHCDDNEAQSPDHLDEMEAQSRSKRSEEILQLREQMGLACRQFPVKETHKLFRTEALAQVLKKVSLKKDYGELKCIIGLLIYILCLWIKDENGTKIVNEYVREYKIGSGSYGKVVLYKSQVDGKHYAIKSFHKSHLLKQRVAPSETAMTDVLREVQIMKMLEHPNIVNLIEVINDPETDHFYMVLEYVEGKWVCEGSGAPGGLGESTTRKYLRDIVSGLMYLHDHKIIHGDIKPDNLLITRNGTVKIGDFNVSQVFEDDNDELRRSPGTPVFTAPECCLGVTYRGRAADTWALGVTLYCMVLGRYPFLGETLQDTYDKIVNNPLVLPDYLNPQLKNLLEGLLCKDPTQRLTLTDVADHDWVIGDYGPIPQYQCWCRRKRLHEESGGNKDECDNQILTETV